MTGADYWAEALTWEGTPFHEQAARKGEGCDCKGLIVGAARVLGLPEVLNPLADFNIYDIGEVPLLTLRRGLKAMLRKVAEPMIGDVLLLNQGGQPQHLAIFGGAEILHTYTQAGKVKRTSTGPALWCWPLESVWRFPSLEAG